MGNAGEHGAYLYIVRNCAFTRRKSAKLSDFWSVLSEVYTAVAGWYGPVTGQGGVVFMQQC